MNKRAISIVVAALALSFSTAAGAVCWGTTSKCIKAEQDRNETAVQENMPDVQKSVTAFYDTLGINPAQTKKGLTIAWQSSRTQWTDSYGQPVHATDHGNAVATGIFSKEGCPQFEVSVLKRWAGTHGDRSSLARTNRYICPSQIKGVGVN